VLIELLKIPISEGSTMLRSRRILATLLLSTSMSSFTVGTMAVAGITGDPIIDGGIYIIGVLTCQYRPINPNAGTCSGLCITGSCGTVAVRNPGLLPGALVFCDCIPPVPPPAPAPGGGKDGGVLASQNSAA